MSDNRADMRRFMQRFHRIRHFRGYGGLKILVLYILREGPKNGAELMDTIDIMSHGHWKPSPGSIYPLLSKAVEENLIEKREDRKYELTRAGHEEIQMFTTGDCPKPESVDSILTDIDSNLSYLEDLPGDMLLPHMGMIEKIGEKLKNLQGTLKNQRKDT